MNTAHHGGPAFPRPAFYPDDPANHMEPGERIDWSHVKQDGMSLRDYFAGQALSGIAAEVGRTMQPLGAVFLDSAATVAYKLADAMLALRQGGGE